MRLLIVTQVVDQDHPVLGFFHGWITALASKYERIEVICLQAGKYELPANVTVHSLGKEKGRSFRIVYTARFFSLIWKLRHAYDAVFVHMNQEYILLAGWIWKSLGKPIYLWRNHFAGSFMTDIAALFCKKIFCTSKFSYTAKYKNTVLMPVGIDTDLFTSAGERMPNSILFIARMAPSKRPDLVIEALGLLKKKSLTFTASFYGTPDAKDQGYFEQIKLRALELDLAEHVQFYSAVPNRETPRIYSVHEICINASPSGMYDKTIFEAAACGCLSLSSNQNLSGAVDGRLLFKEGDADDLAYKIEGLFTVSQQERAHFMQGYAHLVGENSLTSLIERLIEEVSL